MSKTIILLDKDKQVYAILYKFLCNEAIHHLISKVRKETKVHKSRHPPMLYKNRFKHGSACTIFMPWITTRIQTQTCSVGYKAFILLHEITMSGVRSAGELLISRPHCSAHVLVSCTIQLDLVGTKSLISCAALKRPKPLLTVKLARLPPVFLIIARVQTESLWRVGLKPCDFF